MWTVTRIQHCVNTTRRWANIRGASIYKGFSTQQVVDENAIQVKLGEVDFRLETQPTNMFQECAATAQLSDAKVMASVAFLPSINAQKFQQMNSTPFKLKYNEPRNMRSDLPTYDRDLRIANTYREKAATIALEEALRPMFSGTLSQVCVLDINVLSAYGSDPDVLAINAGSLALMMAQLGSDPISAIRIAIVGDEIVIAPNASQQQEATLNMLYAGQESSPTYIMANGKVSKGLFLSALERADKHVSNLCKMQKLLCENVKSDRQDSMIEIEDPIAIARVRDFIDKDIQNTVQNIDTDNLNCGAFLHEIRVKCEDYFRKIGVLRHEKAKIAGSGCVTTSEIVLAYSQSINETISEFMKSAGKRVDDRNFLQVRPTSFDIGEYRGAHGSCLSRKGKTQILSSAAVANGNPGNTTLLYVHQNTNWSACTPKFLSEQHMMKAMDHKVSESDIKSTFFAEQALFPIIPKPEDFPYVINTSSQILSGDGSITMSSISSLSLCLADAGIPIKRHVAGTTVGLLKVDDDDDEQACIALSDTLALEEDVLDGILEIAGSADGLTLAVLHKVNSKKVNLKAVINAVEIGTGDIDNMLVQMKDALPLGGDLHKAGAFHKKIDIPREMLGKIIGPGGSRMRSIEQKYNVKISQSFMGEVHVYGPSMESGLEACAYLDSISGGACKVGDKYVGKVKKIMDYGAVVQLENGTTGWIHISEIKLERVISMADELSIGEELEVICIGKDVRGNAKLSRKALLNK